jgi:hypothetical protein
MCGILCPVEELLAFQKSLLPGTSVRFDFYCGIFRQKLYNCKDVII